MKTIGDVYNKKVNFEEEKQLFGKRINISYLIYSQWE